jgi:hypothetical protein
MNLSFVEVQSQSRVPLIEKLRKWEVVNAAQHASREEHNESMIRAIRRRHSISLVPSAAMVAFYCFVLFFHVGEPPASAEPSEGAAIVVGKGPASADLSFKADSFEHCHAVESEMLDRY